MRPKRRFWKAGQTFQSTFSKHFSTFSSQNRVLTPLKSASKTCFEMFVRPSKIFVWDGYNLFPCSFRLFTAVGIQVNHTRQRVIFVSGPARTSFQRPSNHVGNNICETYPRQIGKGLNQSVQDGRTSAETLTK
jgi:hypothetical protein